MSSDPLDEVCEALRPQSTPFRMAIYNIHTRNISPASAAGKILIHWDSVYYTQI